MPSVDLKDNNQMPNSSAIKRSAFANFMSTLFGWRKNGNRNIEFSKVDIQADDQRIGQALLDNAPNLAPQMSQKLEDLFNVWLSDNTDKFTEIQKRQNRNNQLLYMALNDPYVSRTVDLYADEACQLDQQDTIIKIETPDPMMTRDMYKLLNAWGVTQTRIRDTIKQMATYGDAFWANSVSAEVGVEKIIPIPQAQVADIIEFNPVKAMEMKRKRQGFFGAFASNNYLISLMLQGMEENNNFADMFDTKLFGYYLDNDLAVPAWSVTHFRVGSDGSEFYPFGTSPILGALAPYKQITSAIALQQLGKELSFPITMYKVKTDENMDEGRQFAVVNRVREAYDNIGVNRAAGNSEVYTVNTKIWLPENLVDIDVKKADAGATDGVDDLKFYQDRTAVALGIPKAFYGEEGWGKLGQSGKSITQQYKPFARKCYSLQSAFIESLSDLFRIHFAITGQYDFRVPFTLSMKYPVVEEDDEYNASKKRSIELAKDVVALVKSAIGAADDDTLPADIIRDIIDKYTFLNPADIMKWTRDAKYTFVRSSDEDASPASIPSSDGMPSGMGSGGDVSEPDIGDETIAPDESLAFESRKRSIEDRLYEYANRPMSETQKLREAEFLQRYKEKAGEIYFESLERNAVNNFTANGMHTVVCNQVSSHMLPMLEVLDSQHASSQDRLRENDDSIDDSILRYSESLSSNKQKSKRRAK